MTIQAIKGFKDVIPQEAFLWQHLEGTARDVFARFGFAEIRLPILEKTELFIRSIGEATDIVEKEMYSFTDRNGASVTMRPEGTASLLRAYIEHGLQVQQPVQRLYTIGPMFRHERPQKGRLRQFHQLSCEVLGSDQPWLDSELMAMAWMLLQEIGVSIRLEINSLGCPDCRPGYKETLVTFLNGLQGQLCEDCDRRKTTNPLRVLDCKSEKCKAHVATAPSILDHLCPHCAAHFARVQEGLDLLGVPYGVNHFMVRGLDYYMRTTFELITADLGSQSAVGAGGRYDGLVESLGGPKVPGIGFAMGMERLVLLLQQKEAAAPTVVSRCDLFLVALGDKAMAACCQLAQALRLRGQRVAMDFEGRSLKSQMKQAGKIGATRVLIAGEEELARGQIILKNMATGEQEQINFDTNIAVLAARLTARS